MRRPPFATPFLTAAAIGAASAPVLAQPAPAPPTEGDPGAGQPPAVIVTVPDPTPGAPVPSYPPAGSDPNAHLPSSSRGTTDTSRSSDGFDLNQGSRSAGTVKGSASGAFVPESQYVPDAHTVRRGDTLWDISGQYYKNPYNWPRVWSYNSQIQNPHWIYPGDRVRLREPGQGAGTGLGLRGRRASVPPDTIFLRDVGWIDDREEDTWGEVVGSPDDQMLLSDGDTVYIEIESKHSVEVGQDLVVFKELREVGDDDDDDEDDDDGGMLVSIRGTAKVDRYNPKTHMIRARIVESTDVIERGFKVGQVGRRFQVVAPVENAQDLEAKILASTYPHQFFGQHQVVFLDKGEKNGLKPGNRFFAVRRGDRWRASLKTAGDLARKRPIVEDDRAAEMEDNDAVSVDEDLFPDETYAEIRVLTVRERTCTALVTASTHELERSARLVMKKGY